MRDDYAHVRDSDFMTRPEIPRTRGWQRPDSEALRDIAPSSLCLIIRATIHITVNKFVCELLCDCACVHVYVEWRLCALGTMLRRSHRIASVLSTSACGATVSA